MSEAETGAAEKLRPEAERAWHRGTDAKAKPAHERTTCTRHNVEVGTDCSFLVFSPIGWGLSTRGLYGDRQHRPEGIRAEGAGSYTG